MSVLTADDIRNRGIFSPTHERTRDERTNTSYGLSVAGYDVVLDQDISVYPGFTTLASTRERFHLPADVISIMHDKSTWARRGIQVQNTVAEPGWEGYLTLEITYAPVLEPGLTDEDIEYKRMLLALGRYPPYRLLAGTPIAQVLTHETTRLTDGYGESGISKYQNQGRGPQVAK